MLSAILGLAASLIPAIAEPVSKYQDRKAQVAQAKHEAHLAAIQSGDKSWKDELFVVVVNYPFISMFIPYEPVRQATFNAFEQMEFLPDWFMATWMTVCLSVFGIRELVKVKFK